MDAGVLCYSGAAAMIVQGGQWSRSCALVEGGVSYQPCGQVPLDGKLVVQRHVAGVLPHVLVGGLLHHG